MSLLDDLITVRRVLEQEMARAAATRLTEDELAALAENIEQMEATYDDYDRFRALDNAFHAIVMRASGNEVGLTIVRTIHTHGGSQAAACLGGVPCGAQADGRRAPCDLRRSRSARRRNGRRAHLETHQLRVGREEEYEAIRLTTADHSYDDHPRCGLQLSMSS